MMKRHGLIGWAYVLALLPLIFGSGIFFTWFFARHLYAFDLDIFGVAAVAIFSFLILGVVTLILCGVELFKNRSKWARSFGPVAILLGTLGMITIYADLYGNDDRAYVRIDVRGSQITEVMLWSSHFCTGRRANPSNEALVFTFVPVYDYNWGIKGSASGSPYTIDPVYLEVHHGGSVMTYQLPPLTKRECMGFNMHEIFHLRPAKNIAEVYGGFQEGGD